MSAPAPGFLKTWEDESSAEIAGTVGTSVQNVGYHLPRLEEAGLIEGVDTWYSAKGREMTVYGPAHGPLVPYARAERARPSLSSALQRLFGAVSLIVALTDPIEYSATASLPGTSVSQTAEVELASFDCNRSSTTFDVLADDRIEVETVSTLVGCMNLETEHVDAGEEYSRSVGDGSLPDDRDRKPHDVRITNPTDDTWTTRLVLERGGDLLLDGLYTLEAEATVVAMLTEAGAYQGAVSVPATGVVETFEPGPFDCNDSSTVVTVQSSGELDVVTITTDIACPSTRSNGNDTTGE